MLTLLASIVATYVALLALTFGANGSTLYVAEGSTVHLSHTDSTYATGDYFALGQSNLSGSTPSQIDNLRWRTLAGSQPA